MKTHCDTCKMAMEQGLCQNKHCPAWQARIQLMGLAPLGKTGFGRLEIDVLEGMDA